MPHSFIHAEFHCVFSTKNREPTISLELRQRLYPYLINIADQNGFHIAKIGGTNNHIHILLSLSAAVTIAKAVQLLKGGSSKWIHDTFATLKHFAWQEGYGAFSIGLSQKKQTILYIENQEEHHRHRTFEEEFRAFLIKHGMPFKEMDGF